MATISSPPKYSNDIAIAVIGNDVALQKTTIIPNAAQEANGIFINFAIQLPNAAPTKGTSYITSKALPTPHITNVLCSSSDSLNFLAIKSPKVPHIATTEPSLPAAPPQIVVSKDPMKTTNVI